MCELYLEYDNSIETIIAAGLFGENPVVYREAATKEGPLERIDWPTASYEYLDECSDAIYTQLAWTMEVADIPEDGGTDKCWSIYKIPSDIYLMSNSISWYDEGSMQRKLTGQVFVIKRVDGDLKIVSFINIQ